MRTEGLRRRHDAAAQGAPIEKATREGFEFAAMGRAALRESRCDSCSEWIPTPYRGIDYALVSQP